MYYKIVTEFCTTKCRHRCQLTKLMKSRSTQKSECLAEGQIWKTRLADIEILRIWEQFIHYKITSRVGQKRVSAQISGIEPMAHYLKLNGASLHQRSCRNERVTD